MRAAGDVGYDVAWFAAQQTVMVIHQLTFERLRPVRYPEKLEFTTWLSDMQKIRTHREHIVRNAATGDVIARGRVHWVHLSRGKLLPVRIPQDLVDRFQPNGVFAISHIEPRQYPAADTAVIEFVVTRHVHRYEADEMQHVNNTIYVDWLEEALADAVTAHSKQLPANARLCVRRHDIEYARSAVPGDDIEITVRLVGVGHCASAWRLEIKRDDESLVRDHITAMWLDDIGRPVRWECG